MEAIAKYRKIRLSPRKARLVVGVIRGMSVPKALDILKALPNKAAAYTSKVLLSAVANLEYRNTNHKLLRANIYVKEIYVDGGPALKRVKPVSRGMAHRIRKPSCHITVKVGSRERDEELLVKKQWATKTEGDAFGKKPVEKQEQTKVEEELVTGEDITKASEEQEGMLVEGEEAAEQVVAKQEEADKGEAETEDKHDEDENSQEKE